MLMLAPFAPHIAEELWQRLGHDRSLAYEPFPVADPALLVAESVTYPVQVNGKVRGRVEVAADADEEAVRAAALAGSAAALERPGAPQGHRGAGPDGQRRRLTGGRPGRYRSRDRSPSRHKAAARSRFRSCCCSRSGRLRPVAARAGGAARGRRPW